MMSLNNFIVEHVGLEWYREPDYAMGHPCDAGAHR
jgi:hypothetical protein